MSPACALTNSASFVPGYRRLMRAVFHLALLAACALAFCRAGYSQSTFGTVLGTVKDPSGSLIPMANVHLMNAGTNAERSAITGSNGSYEFVNIDAGKYKITVEASGFQLTETQIFDLDARATARVDVDLKVASQATTVNVEAVSIVQTDASNVSETKGSLELTNLPVAIGTRSQGSTSAFSTLTAQPGVQIDNNNNITVAGASPSQISLTVDGISSVGPGTLGALTELFPSFNSIEEIKISETLNPAEYGGVADVTTVSKSGTNEFHGGLFENVQNTDFNAADTFSHIVTPVKLNDFGLFLGGPIIIPKLYNGRNKTFFFGSYEALRLPKNFQYIQSVPSVAMRSGDLTAYDGTVIPASQINPYAQKLMDFFYPLPNYGPPGAVSNNYVADYSTPINSSQGDIRVDQSLGPKHLIYVRYSYKNRRVTNYPKDSNGNPGSPLVGETSNPEIYNSMVAAYNWVISPSLVNELRGGFTAVRRGFTTGFTAQQSASILGLTSGPGALPGALPPGYDTPTISIEGFMGSRPQTADVNPSEGTYQATDTLTWTKSKHTFKFGGDWRYLSSLNTQVFNDYRMGSYEFNGSAGLGYSPFAGFLLGYPDLTTIATVVNPDTDAYASHYAVFAQDDWKVSQSLTINYGLRWEYNPGFLDKNNNVTNFDPYYSSTINGQVVQGAMILPNQAALANVNPQFVQSVAPIPIILASQAGVPSNLRQSSKRDFAPRVGFAWRVGGNNKTVLRGGYGRFIETLLSATAINGWSVESSDVGYFTNGLNANGTPMFSLPYSFPADIAQPGTQFFDLASEIHYKDPIVEEWNLTLERDLGKGVGLRVSYDGNHSYNLPVTVNADQPKNNTSGFDPSLTPFPAMAYIATSTNLGFSNYNAGTISVHKRSANLQFEVAYTFTSNLTNVYGCGQSAESSFVTEGAFNTTLCSPYQPGIDYGNTPFNHRSRVLASFLYELPFGKGQAFLNGNRFLSLVAGGWELSGVALFQTGPYLTVTTLNDPSGAGYNLFSYNGGRADTVPGVSPYAGQSLNQWINPNAFVDPPNAIGRFGDSLNGAVTGPGTQAVSLSLLKRFSLTERMRAEIGMQVSNAFNHANYNPPSDLTLTDPGFGQISSMQVAEGAGPRQIQLTGRLTF
jgi:hypothetical protein